ncbi:MAG: DUF308 domain-containing protein [Candidatus Odinarchaeia archaeon]
MSTIDMPTSERALNIIVGSFAILIAILVLVFPSITVSIIFLLLLIAIIVLSIGGIIRGATGKGRLSNNERALNITLGVIGLILGILGIVYLNITVTIVIYIMAAGLLIYGIGMMVTAAISSEQSKGMRTLTGILGAIAFILSFFVFIYPSVGVAILIIILAIALIVIGVQRIIFGAVGKYYGAELDLTK